MKKIIYGVRLKFLILLCLIFTCGKGFSASDVSAQFNVTIESVELEKPSFQQMQVVKDPKKAYLSETEQAEFNANGYIVQTSDATLEGSVDPMNVDVDSREITVTARYTKPGIFFIRPYQNKKLSSLDDREILNFTCCINLAEPSLSYTHLYEGLAYTNTSTYTLDWEKYGDNSVLRTYNALIDVYFYSEY